MRTALGIGKGILKVLFVGIVAVGAFIMNCIGAIICAIMAKKEETPQRRARRNYEIRNKEEREQATREQATKQFNTRLSRETHDEICSFLKEHRISKVELIYAGYEALRSQLGPQNQPNKE